MNDRLTDLQMLKLVELYREHECLWNHTNRYYKVQRAREMAYKDMSKKLNIPGLTPRVIPKKIKNMRSSYYQELKRIEKSISTETNTNFLYKPKVSWFTKADEFLKNFTFKKETVSNIDITSNATSDNDSETPNMEPLESVYYEENSIDEDANPITEYTDDINDTKPLAVDKEIIEPKRVKVNEYEKILKAFKKFEEVAKTNTKRLLIESKDDEFDLFGKYIATTLRNLPDEHAIIAKTEVQKVLSDYQLKALRDRQSQIIKFEEDSCLSTTLDLS